jgi:hypothetical protein
MKKHTLQALFTGLLAFTVLLSCAADRAEKEVETHLSYVIVDTGQTSHYAVTGGAISTPSPGDALYGQDADHTGNTPAYQDNADGTVTDLNTDLMWQQSPDMINKSTFDEAVANAASFDLASYDDWRLPSIKELYSLMDFSGSTGMTAASSVPYIDTNYFDFEYGDESVERFIDAQYCSSTEYVWTTMNGDHTVFGVNFADGRIKGYGTNAPHGEKTFFVRYVRGNADYGVNDFSDQGDGTIVDHATGLMWEQDNNGEGLNWEEALAWVAQKNNENHLGYDDWRLPNAKELQSIVDYSRSPATTDSAAIDPLFNASAILDEGGEMNWPFYWTSTTHLDGPPESLGFRAVYLAFGEALGFMESPPDSGSFQLLDVHGAGAQRSDPKSGDPSEFPYGHGPQGDVIRIYNHVRCVRDADLSAIEGEGEGEGEGESEGEGAGEGEGEGEDEGEGEGEGEVEGEDAGEGEGETTPELATLICILSDSSTGTRITNGTIAISPAVLEPITINTNGVYTLSEFDVGTYTVDVSAPGYLAAERTVTLQSGAITLLIALNPMEVEGEVAAEGEVSVEGEAVNEGEGEQTPEGEDTSEGEIEGEAGTDTAPILFGCGGGEGPSSNISLLLDALAVAALLWAFHRNTIQRKRMENRI